MAGNGKKVIGARGRGRTGTALRRRDFKSRVSTNFTTRADKGGIVYPGRLSDSIKPFYRLQ